MRAKFIRHGRLGAVGVLAFCLAASAPHPAFANGGDFFEELSANWGKPDSDAGLSYFGFVRDTRGKAIPDARISATTAGGSRSVVQGDMLGHYKIPGFAKSVDPMKVQITCSKTGYRLIRRDRRVMRGAPKAPVETDCILAPETGVKPAA